MWDKYGVQEVLPEPYAELDPHLVLETEAPGAGVTGKVNRNSPQYIRWVQNTLNRTLGLQLAVDGSLGQQTRNAIRSFQQQRGLAADGIVGSQTEAALRAVASTVGTSITSSGGTIVILPGRPAAVLDNFDFDNDRLKPHHEPQIDALARQIVASQSSQGPVRAISLIGHTDPVGNQNYNLDLGRRRVGQVARRLGEMIRLRSPNLQNRLAITVDTHGETQAVAGDKAKSRRVEIFLRTSGGPPPPHTGLDPARWTPIMRAPDLRTGNFVNFLVDGATTFRAMHNAILTAKNNQHYIYLLAWCLGDDFPLVPPLPGLPVTIRDLFAQASGRGVQIRAMLWDQVGRSNSAEVGRINSLTNGAAILDNHTFGRLRSPNVGSHHQKVLVVKGEEGLITFCGGLDLNRDRVVTGPGHCSSSGGSSSGGGGGSNPQHDIHCQIVGPAAHDLLATFIRRWDAHPEHTRIDRTRGDLRGRREPLPAPLPPRAVGSNGGNCAARITRTYEPKLPFAPGTMALRERSIRQTLIEAIRNARRFIYMEEQYLVNMEAAALLNAALSRIQHLTILIPDSSITSMPRVWEGRLNFINRLRQGPHGHKARVFILSNPPNRPGTPLNLGPHTYVHAKTWVIDDELAIIGSANCNQRGWTHDSEVNAVIFEPHNPSGPTFAQRLRMSLWAEHLNVLPSAVSDGITSASLWATPPAGARVRPYNPRADTDSWSMRRVPWNFIDPAGPP